MATEREELLELIMVAAKDKKQLELLLKDLLTPAEYREIATRWQIVQHLVKGEGQRSIARELKTGLTTITRGVHTLENENGGFNQMLRKLRRI